jgi:hypothetical protein
MATALPATSGRLLPHNAAAARLATRARGCLSGASDRWLWIFAIVALVAVQASRVGSDANWDLRNYHLYNAHALISGRFWTDIAAAQMQMFLSPGLDIAMGAIRDRLNATPMLCDIVLSIPHGVAAALAFLLTLRVIPTELPGRAPLAMATALFSAAGAAGYPTLATSMSEMLPACCVLAGLLLLTGQTMAPRASAVLAGAMFGIAAGLKLTAAPYCVAATVALLVVSCRGASRVTVAWFVLAGLATSALVGGPWWWLLYHNFGNPILPHLNQVFHSEFVDPRSFTDRRFLPQDLWMALAYPFYWAVQPNALVSELPMRDPRFAMAYVAVAALAVQALRRPSDDDRRDRTGTLLAVFLAVSFVLWEAQFSILRFLAIPELLCGAVVLAALRPLLIRPCLRVRSAMSFVAICAAAQALTVYPDWGRIPGMQPTLVRVPALEPNALVVLLDPSPMAYLADFLPPSVRLVGANNNLIQPGDDGRLARQAETAIQAHAGPLYGLEDPAESPGAAGWTLMYYRLHRGKCSPVVSNLDNNAIHLCRLWPYAG